MCVSFLVAGSYICRCRPAALQREQLRRRMRRSFLAECRILRRPHRGSEPQAALLVEHRVVDVVLAGPDRFFAVVRRRRGHLRRGRRRIGIANGQRNLADGVGLRIEHRHVVRAELERAIEQAVRVEGGIAAIGRHHVVQVRLRIGPVPHRDHDVALEALRPRRRRRHLAAVDAIGPVGEQQQRALLAEIVEAVDHLAAGLARREPPLPRMLTATGTCPAPSESRACPWCRADGTRCSRRT